MSTISPDAQAFLDRGEPTLLIDGRRLGAQSGARFDTVDPSANAVLASCDQAGAEDVDAAVAAARRALAGPWSELLPAQRASILNRVADLLERDATALGELEALDAGKPVAVVGEVDVPGAVDAFRFFAGLPQRLDGKTIPVSTPAPHLNYTTREPIGVVGQIIPWNYPLLLAAWKLAPALACGNACILKPAEQSPLTAVWLADLLVEAGVPPGVVGVLTGGPETGRRLSEHPDVDAVSFTGSTEVGRKILIASAVNLKRVGLELGGKSPNIVFADADLDKAVPAAAEAVFWNTGQECAAGSRLFVERAIYDEFVERLAETARSFRLGPAIAADTELGPLISQEQRAKVLGYVEAGLAEGAQLVAGGATPGGDLEGGFFMQPTVFAEASNQMRIAREEIFGPVASVIGFEDFDDAVEQANATPYGLAAGVWTRDISRAHRTAAALQAGMVWINCYNAQDPASPFGGYKQSGVGREMGDAAVELYTEVKSVWVALD